MMVDRPSQVTDTVRNPFADLRVVEVGTFVAAAWAGRVLADFGCDVVKVERPQGDDSRRYGPFPPAREGDPEASGLHLYLNANKRGVTLDLRQAEDRGTLDALLSDADILLVDLSLREQEDLGMTYESLRSLNDHLIVTSITPYGMTGPHRYRKAYDLNISAASGVAVGMGRAGEPPLGLPLVQPLFQGGVAAAAASLVALLARDTNRAAGQQVEIAMEEVLATQHTGRALPTFIYRGITGYRSGTDASYFGHYPSGNYWCKDGQITLSAPQLDQWIRFVKVLGEPEWTRDPRYRDRRAMQAEYREEVDALIAPWLQEHTRDEILEIAIEHRLPFAPVLRGSDVLRSAHYRERGVFVDVSRDGSDWEAPRPGHWMSAIPFDLRRPAPLLGEHNAEVLGRVVVARTCDADAAGQARHQDIR